MDQDMTLMQMLRICLITYIAFYILTAICFTIAYPDTVQEYLHSQGIHWNIPGATRDPTAAR